ncbi:MAG: SPASM domain-containing protein, partial [Firmicutes bacterium]|nr:SPASM domain-containing protein [Bacillota bacterium]
VNTNGEFFPCERVSETSDAMKIGNIKDGFDYNKARKILNIAQLTENACKNCWAMRYCTICVKSCDNNGELSGELKLIQCKIVINSTDEIFKDNIMLNEIKQLLKTSQ